MRTHSALLGFLLLSLTVAASRAEEPNFRTDAHPKSDLPWFPLVAGEFPPENSAHAISGELIEVDHLERRFRLRVDRNDSQQAGHLDLPLDGVMLPYGSIYRHGAPAALRDIPLGTHLHGLFYLKDPQDKTPPPVGRHRRVAAEADFTRCLRLEDDFSHHARQGEHWKIESVDLAARQLTATLQQDGELRGTPQVFDLLSSTRVFIDKGFGKLESLSPGQTVQFNLTWATLYGPGRIREIWVDEQSRNVATAQQLEVHRNHVRERGLPGWIEAVDDESQIVTITFFDGVDPQLFDELTHTNPQPHGWPFSAKEDDSNAPKGGICVADENLLTYDPVNDRKGGNILKIGTVATQPGSSGVQIQVKCGMLLEGFRPHHIVRFYPATWKVDALPLEEQLFGRD